MTTRAQKVQPNIAVKTSHRVVGEPNIALKIAIVESRQKSFRLALRMGILPDRLSKIANGHATANQKEQKVIAKVLRRQVEDLFPMDLESEMAS